jgi:hypothetical protein
MTEVAEYDTCGEVVYSTDMVVPQFVSETWQDVRPFARIIAADVQYFVFFLLGAIVVHEALKLLLFVGWGTELVLTLQTMAEYAVIVGVGILLAALLRNMAVFLFAREGHK